MIPTQPLRDEHQELLPQIHRLREVAAHVGEAPVETLRREVGEVHEFLVGHLLVHATAEEHALYPAVEEVTGAPGFTATMSRDHEEVAARVAALGALHERLERGESGPEVERALREVLYGLHALVEVHFLKEEAVYLPLLDERLSPDRAERLFEDLHGAAHEAEQTLQSTA